MIILPNESKRMKKIRTIIVDDDYNCRLALSQLIKHYFKELEIVAELDSVVNAVQSIKTLKPHLVFLDIEMPEEKGLELFNYIIEPDFHTVITTAFRDYALNAFKLPCIDYLLKPINPAELKTAIEKVQKAIKLKHKTLQLQDNSIFLHTSKKTHIVNIKDIIFCRSDNSYTIFKTVDEQIVVSKNMGQYQNQLEENGLIRIGRSLILNFAYIASIEHVRSNSIILRNNEKILISATEKVKILEYLKGN